MSRRAELESQLAGSQSRHGSAQLDGADDHGRSHAVGNDSSALLDGDAENEYDMDEEDIDNFVDEGEHSDSVVSISPVSMQGLESSNPLAAFKTQDSQLTDPVQPPQTEQTTQPTQTATTTATTHPEIMRKMFPHGMTEEQRRADFPGQLFRISTPKPVVVENVPEAENVIAVEEDDDEPVGDIPP